MNHSACWPRQPGVLAEPVQGGGPGDGGGAAGGVSSPQSGWREQTEAAGRWQSITLHDCSAAGKFDSDSNIEHKKSD